MKPRNTFQMGTCHKTWVTENAPLQKKLEESWAYSTHYFWWIILSACYCLPTGLCTQILKLTAIRAAQPKTYLSRILHPVSPQPHRIRSTMCENLGQTRPVLHAPESRVFHPGAKSGKWPPQSNNLGAVMDDAGPGSISRHFQKQIHTEYKKKGETPRAGLVT